MPLSHSETKKARIGQKELDRFWSAMEGKFGTRWARELGNSRGPAAREYQEQLDKLTGKQMRKGMEFFSKAENQKFVPTAAVFVDACRPSSEELGIPDFEKAYQLAARMKHMSQEERRKLHPVVYRAALHVGLWDLANDHRAKTEPLFRLAYKTFEISFRAGTCDPVPEPESPREQLLQDVNRLPPPTAEERLPYGGRDPEECRAEARLIGDKAEPIGKPFENWSVQECIEECRRLKAAGAGPKRMPV